MARRAGALFVVVVLVTALVVGLRTVAGGRGAADGPPPAGSTGGTGTSGDAPSGMPGAISEPAASASAASASADGTTDNDETDATSTTMLRFKESTSDGPPTAEDPALVYVAGDSDAGTFAPYLGTLLSETGVVDIELDYKVSSGLSRPDFFNWPERFADTLPSLDPDIVIVTFGGNDAQGLTDVSGGFVAGEPNDDTKRWKDEYGRRVAAVMDTLSADGRTLIWVGIPNDDNPEVTARMKVQDTVVREQAAKRRDVIFVDTWRRFSGRNGNWAEYVVDPRDGEGKDVRAGDGFHLNETGAQILAIDIAEAVRTALRHRGADV